MPTDFVFSVEGLRYITHLEKLADVGVPLANFFASGVLALGPWLGPILWQLPPSLGFDAARMEAFFRLLPRTAGEALRQRLRRRRPRRLGHEGPFLGGPGL